VDLLQI
jgi:NADH-quinone oxidoreductase subunit H